MQAPSYTRRRPEETALHQALMRGVGAFIGQANARGRDVPRFIETELRAYQTCGDLAYGFSRVHCRDCGFDRLPAFSCKGRGFCPSCNGRRMADTAARLVDHVLPPVPYRQWVVSFPRRQKDLHCRYHKSLGK